MPVMNVQLKGGGTTPTGTKLINTNGIHDVAGYANADVQVPNPSTGTLTINTNGQYNVTTYANVDVQVPTTAPACYRAFRKNNNNELVNSITTPWIALPSGTKILTEYILYKAYMDTPSNVLSGNIDFSTIETVKQYALNNCFKNCTGITSVNLSSLKDIERCGMESVFEGCTGITGHIDLSGFHCIYVNGTDYAVSKMFKGCTGITSADLSSFEAFASYWAREMFDGCSSLSTVDISSIKSVNKQAGVEQMFGNCTSLTSINLNNLVDASAAYACIKIFYNCSNLASIDLSSLCKLGGNALEQAFVGSSLTSLSFPNLAYTTTNINSAFANTLKNVNGCTVHFPAEWQTTMSGWSNIQNGMGGTNTTILFDLPNVTTLDLSRIKSIKTEYALYELGRNNYFPNITSVDFSSLEIITGAYGIRADFENSTGISSFNFSKLAYIEGNNCFESFCKGNTSLTSMKFPSLKYVDDPLSNYDRNFFNNTFQNCTNLTSLSFPALCSTSFGTHKSPFYNMLSGVAGCEIHFPKNLDPQTGSTTISRLTQYPNFGGTNTVLVFDLPSTNHLIGANSVEYERSPKDDTMTALAWRVKDDGTITDPIIDWTPYYTNTTADPQVNNTIYSDSACTTAVTTIDSIA